jgi:hypothetical protein
VPEPRGDCLGAPPDATNETHARCARHAIDTSALDHGRTRQGTAMDFRAIRPAPSFDSPCPAPLPPTRSWLRQSFVRGWQSFARWNERRRAQLIYRRDLRLLAKLGERELADFGAPGWLRADVQRYRNLSAARGGMP